MKVVSVVILLALVAFFVYQVFGVIKDIKKKRLQKKESLKEKEKTE